MKLITTLVMVGLCLAGCGDDSTTETESSQGSTTPSTLTAADGASTLTPASDASAGTAAASATTPAPGASGLESSTTVTPGGDAGVTADVPATCAADAPGEICVMVQVPTDIPSIPEKVSIHFFNQLPPIGPPNLMGAEIAEASELAQFTPGASFPMVLSGIPSDGGMFLYGVLYMPGGGAQTWQSVPGVDFHGAYDWYEPVPFTGQPTNLPKPLSFTVFEN